MNEKLEIKWRGWYKGSSPRPIKLEIPGWAGESNNHQDGDKPQPWHCIPFIEGSIYGLELLYPFDTECHVKMVNNEVKFEGDFDKEQPKCPGVFLPPFSSFAPGHFGMTSALDIKAPPGYVLRLEPHPRYYTDITYTVPCCLPGHLQTEWWPKIFFVVFKNPMPGQTLIFKKNEPYGQIIFLPKKVNYDIKEMNNAEATERAMLDDKINNYCKKFVKNDWHDHKGHNFDDKYKILSGIFAKEGLEGIHKLINSLSEKIQTDIHKKFKSKLIIRKKSESI